MVYTYVKNDNGEFICPHCKFTSKAQNTMHYHLAKHEGKLPHPCKHCDMRFPQKGVLDIHMKLQHPAALEKKEMFACPCDGCGYQDIRKGNRLIHFLRVHLKDLTEKLKTKTTDEGCVVGCTGCNKSFKSNTMFYYHAHTCVKLEDSHRHYSEWTSIKA